MSKIIYKKPGFLTVFFMSLAGKEWIDFKWQDMYIEKKDIVEAHEKALNEAKINKVKTYVASTENAERIVLREDVLTWWASWIPKMFNGGVKKIINVNKPSTDQKAALGKLCNKQWTKSVVGGIEVVDMDNPGAIRDEID